MRFFLVGVSCIGKSTIGALLTKQLNYNFYDLDDVIEIFFKRLLKRCKPNIQSLTHFENNRQKP